MLPDDFVTHCRRAFDRDPSTAMLLALLEEAWRAGRESAYDRDEWRVLGGPDEFPVVFQDEIFSEEHLEIVLRDARNRWRGEVIWVEHCRNGSSPWVRVPEAGDADAEA